MKRFLCLQQEKARFWSVFYVYKMKKHAFDWAFFVFAKKENHVCHVCKMKNLVLSRFHVYKLKYTTFCSGMRFHKMKEHVCEALSCTKRKNTLLKRSILMFVKQKNIILRRFHVYKMKYTLLRSFCFYKKFIFQGFCMLIKW